VIVLENIHKAYRTSHGEKWVLNDVSYAFDRGQRTGILGASGSGKSTLMRLIAGIERPTKGAVRRTRRVSWPLPSTDFFHPRLSVAENITFAARIYGEEPSRIIAFVERFAGLAHQLDSPFSELQPIQKTGLSLGLGMAIQFEVYLVDELFIRGNRSDKQRFESMIERRLRLADVIVASRTPKTIQKFCQNALILHNGHLFRFPHLTSAVETYRQLVNAEAKD
jgi:capsular polysaccharide transport system ATP-binding protein